MPSPAQELKKKMKGIHNIPDIEEIKFKKFFDSKIRIIVTFLFEHGCNAEKAFLNIYFLNFHKLWVLVHDGL